MANAFDKTSFIPKKNLSPRPIKKKKSVGLLFIIAIIVFLISVLSVIGVVAYKQIIERNIEGKAVSLERFKEAFDPGLIENLSRLDAKIESAKSILDSHIAINPFLDVLEDLTLKNVKFDELKLSVNSLGEVVLTVSGQATDYATVVLQSDTFGESRFLRDQIFSDVNLDKSGNVNFSLNAKVDPGILSFRSSVEGF